MIGLLLLLSGAGQAAPEAPLPRPVNPDWERLPTADGLADLYPELARDNGVTGRAEIKCKILAAGLLSDCVVVSETPAGLGFGRATLQAARYFKMRPKTINGTPVAGGIVTVPLRWRLARDERPEPTAADLPAAETCLGWAQARADLDHSQWSFSAAAKLSEAFGQAAGRSGLKPSQMLARRREALADVAGRVAETTDRDAAQACGGAFGVGWPPLHLSLPAPAPAPRNPPVLPLPAPGLPAQFLTDERTISEVCLALTAADLERNPAAGKAESGAYAAWSKTFTWVSLMAGRTSTEVNDQLSALAEDGARRLAKPHGADMIATCVKSSEDAPPVG